LIVALGNVDAVGRATSTIPIVFVIASDPVKIGSRKSLAPGGNATGVSMLTATLTRLDQIRELLPPHTTVGFLVNPDNSELLLAIEQIARSTGQPLILSPKIEGRQAFVGSERNDALALGR